MRTLDEITVEIAKFHDALNASGGDVALAAQALGLDEAQFLADYDAIAFEDAAKLDAYIFRLEESKAREASAQAMVDQWEARIQEWKAKVKAEERSQEFMKSRLKVNMEAKGETKITTPEGRVIAIQKNGGAVPVIIDKEVLDSLSSDDLNALEEFGLIALEPLVNKAAVGRFLSSPNESELGAATVLKFAKLGERGTSLRIK